MPEPGGGHQADTIASGGTDSTVSSGEIRLPSAPSLPDLASWDRYEVGSLLGVGGMGQVFRAWDPRLRRHVALKFLRAADPDWARRFLQEAQAQARVEHEHVCKVYEVGEVHGRPYIAMQYIEGKTLGSAARSMPLEQRVRVLQKVAEAVHAAHRLGLIHRDVKPANVLVERTEDGLYRPYVTDFGLAREMERVGPTQTGAAIGTPHYMSPEQARGQGHRLDRRTDVYSLGATLYELLSGRPPFDSMTSFDVLVRVLDTDPTPLRKLDATIPVDLETIVMKCLEKEPQRRYDTARALAEDLGRYLDGEPVQARRASLVYRVRKRARKHKGVVAVGAVAAVGLLLLGTMALEARRTAAEKAHLAQRFGQEVERMEALSRYAYLLPLHDTRSEKALIRERMREIAAQMRLIGRASQGPGHYALGRGHLALGELDAARRELEAAWSDGFRSPEVAFALGQTLGALYERAMAEAQRISNPDLRAARHREIERTLREPALRSLHAAGSSLGEVALYAEGLLAFIEKRYDEALAKARHAARAVPWLYEARRLEGDVELARGREYAERGDYPAALAHYEQAGAVYRAAADLARSDPAVRTAECVRFILTLVAIEKRGQSPESAYAQGVAACDQALRADPDDAEALGKKATLHAQWALYQSGQGQDPEPALAHAIALAAEATRRSPRDLSAWLGWGNAHETRADHEIAHGRDPSAALAESIRGYRTVLELDPNFALAWSSLGNAHLSRAEWEEQHGRDPGPAQAAAIESYRKAVALDPDFAAGYNNIGNVYLMRAAAESDRGADPRLSLVRAIESYEKAVRENPNLTVAHNNTGLCWQEKANYEAARGEDPRPSLAHAVASFERAVAQKPSYANGWHNLGVAHRAQAAYLCDHGVDPGPELGAARAALERAAAINPDDFEQYLEQGEQALVAARWASMHGQAPQGALDAGERAVAAGLGRNANAAELHRVRAELLYRRADWLVRGNQAAPARETLRRGLAAVGRARSINPEGAPSMLLEGRLELLAARLEPDVEARVKAASRARRALEQALAKNPVLRAEVAPLLAQARELQEKSSFRARP